MRESIGRFHRPGLHRERAQYLSILLQRSDAGKPCYVTDADFTDGARIQRKLVQRLAQLQLRGTEGPNAWKLENNGENENFLIKGGNNTDEGMAGAWVGGLRATLYQDVDYKCERLGAFSTTLADQVHHRWSALDVGLLTDDHAKWTPHVFQGLGLKVQVGGLGEFTVTDNTATTLTLGGGFDPTNLSPHAFYYFTLAAPAADVNQTVWLDVHIEDWGMAEDPQLNHNPTGTAVECARRERLVKRVWVQQVAAGEQPTTDYTDLRGARHYLLQLGSLVREADQAVPDVLNDREENASSGQELEAARSLQFICVDDDELTRRSDAGQGLRDDLADRLLRDQTVITVGPTGTLYGAHFTGPEGLQAALACDAAGPRTVFLRNGTYSLDGQLVVRRNWTLIGESKNAIINLDETVNAAESMRVERHARVANLTIARIVGGSGATAAVRLAGRAALLERVYLSDNLADQPAVLVESESAVGGTGLVDCDILKAGGPAVVFAQSNSSNVGVGATTGVVGSLPTLPVDADEYTESSYGAHLTRCRIHTVAASYAESRAAIRVLGGDSVHISECEVQVQGCPALVVAAPLAGGENPSTWNSRGGVLVDDTDFLVVPSAAYAGLVSRGLKLISGRVVMRDCRAETLDAGGQHPNAMVGFEPSSELLDLDCAGLHVRTGAATAVRVIMPSLSASRASLERVHVVPMSATSGPSIGIRAQGGAVRGAVTLQDCRVTGWNVMLKGFDLEEGVVLEGECFMDGTDCTPWTLTAGAVGSDPTAAFYITSRADSGVAPVLRGCRAVAHGCVGFLVVADNDYEPRALLEDCRVEGQSRTLVGFLAQGRGRMLLENCRARLTRGACVSNETVRDTAIEVVGGEFADAGQEYLTDGAFPAVEDASFAADWAACVRLAYHVSGHCKTVRGAVGFYPTTGGEVSSCKAVGSRFGILVEKADVLLDDPLAVDCAVHGLLARNGAHRLSGRMRVRGPGLSGATLVASQAFDLDLDVQVSAKSAKGVQVSACTEGWRLTPRVSCPDGSDIAPLRVESCVDGVVEGAVARGRARQPILLANVVGVRIQGVVADCGRALTSSLVVDSSEDLELERARLRFGAILGDASRKTVVSDFRSQERGLAVHPGNACDPVLRDVVVESAVAGAEEVVAASGIYFGGPAGARVDQGVVMERCRVLNWQQIGYTLDSDVGAAVGRSAGIRVQAGGANTSVRLVGCETRGPGGAIYGVLVGDLNVRCDYQTNSGANLHRYGVRRLEVVDCVFRQEDPEALSNLPKLVAVVRNDLTAAHTITGCTFDATEGVVGYLYSEMNQAEVFARVDFKGNVSRRRAFDDYDNVPYLLQSQYIFLDGGLANDEFGGGTTTDAKWALDWDGAGEAEIAADIKAAVQRTNSVWAHLADYIPADLTAP